MTGLERAILRLAESYVLIGPYNGQCGLCGGPDQRHRVADAITERYQAGEDIDDIAADFLTDADGVPADFKALAVIAASLAWEVAARKRRMTAQDQAEALAVYWPAVRT